MAKTMEERRREMNAKYGRKEKEKNTFSLPVAESEEAKKENTSRMDELRKEMNEKYNLVSKVNDKFISDFMSDVNSLSKGYQDTYDGVSWGTAASTYDAQAKTIADLRKRSGAIRQYLNKNKDSIDPESYKSWMTELDSTGEWMNSYLDSFSTAKKHYGQWKTEDEYNGWVEWYEDYEAKLNFNLDAGKRDIDYLQNELNAIETVEKQISAINQENQILNLAKAKGDRNAIAKLKANEEKLSQLNGALEDAFAKYGSKADLSSYISQKSAYYTLAERTQKAAELASVADVNSENYDPEFNMYAQMGADIKNPTAEEAEGRKAEVGNIVTYSRDNADMMAIGEVNGGGSSIGGRSIYSLMKKEEVDLYNYYLAKYGKDKAQEYLDSIEDTLQQRHGEKMYDTLKDKPLLEYSFGVLAGLDQFTSGVSSLFSNEDYIPTTSIQYASGMVREDLADSGIPMWYNFKTGEWEDKVLGNSSGQIFYDAITTTSNMLPSMLTSTALSAVAPGVGTVAGSVILGASAAGNAKAEMLNLGYSKEQATTYGIMVGIAEGSMEYFLGHIPGLSKGDGIFSSLATKAVSKVDNALARVAIAIGGSFDEALEEGLQTIIEPWLKEIATGVDWDNPSVDEVLYSSLLGALSSIGLEGGTGAINLGINTVQKNQAIKNHGQTIIEKGGVDPLRELALEVAGVKQDGEANGLTREGKKLANLAEKVEKKATPKNVGKLSAKLEGTITKQNRTEIESALTEKGLSAKEAKLAADYLTDSKELTSEQISMVEGDKRFVEAIDEVLYGSDTKVSTNSLKLAEARIGKISQNSLNSDTNGDIITNNESEVISDESTDGLHLRNGSERLGSTDTEESVFDLESSTGTNKGWRKNEVIADSEAARLVNEGREVSVASLGILRGSKNHTVRLVDEGIETATMKQARARASERGLNVKFFVGDNLVIADNDGKLFAARAYINGSTMLVRADHPYYTSDQLTRHEIGHDMIAKGEVNIEDVRKRLKESVGEENVDGIADRYATAYEGTNMSPDEIWEECICDSLGDMNIFASDEIVSKFMGPAMSEVKSATENTAKSPTQTRGSPEGKASRETDRDNYSPELNANRVNAKGTNYKLSAREYSLQEIADIYKRAKLGSEYDILFDRLYNFCENAGIKFYVVPEILNEEGKRKTGVSRGDQIKFSQNRFNNTNMPDKVKSNVILHEMLHAATVYAMRSYNTAIKGGTTADLPKHIYKSCKEIYRVYAAIKNDQLFAGDYGVKNAREMVAMLIDPEFTKKLKATYPSVWHKLLDAICQILGINKSFTNYDKLTKAVDEILSHPDYALAQKYNSIVNQNPYYLDESQYTDYAPSDNVTPEEAKESGKISDAKFSIEFADDIANKQRKYAEDGLSRISSEELEKAIADTAHMVKEMKPYANILPQDKVGKTLVKNGSYDVSVENTTVCIRTLAYNSFVDMVSEKVGRPLTQMESFLVSQKLYEIAKEPQCLYCYVSLDRKAFNEMVIRYAEQRDQAIKAYEEAGKPKIPSEMDKEWSLFKEFLDGRKPTKNMWDRYVGWLKAYNKGEKLVSLADISTEAKRLELVERGGEAASQVKDILKYAQSASWAKKQTQYVAYYDEILKLKPSVIRNLNNHYGMRWYSFSDYSGAFIVENMQQITDAAIRGLKGLSYTKDTDFAEIFAPTGMNINISVYATKTANGYEIDAKQSANIDEAIKLREKYPNVGIVVVATDKGGVEWALAQEWSDVVIPFHTVRTGADVAEFYNWEIFNAEQSDTVTDQNLWDAYVNEVGKKKASKNVYPSEHQNNKETYLSVCEKRGLTPRFKSFLDNPNYMKLVNETRQSEGETSPLKAKFDVGAAERSFDKFVEKGGYYEGWYNDGIDVDGEADIVAEDVRAGRKANEVSYGRQDVNFEDVAKGRKTNREHGHASRELDFIDYIDEQAESEGRKRESAKPLSNRDILADALESVAQNDIERNKLKEYKEKIARIESEQAKLSEIRAKIKELSFAKGKRDTEAINKLRFQENQTANRINTYDRQLFNLEATAALKGVLQREKELARRKEAQKNKEVLANYREKAAKTQRELLTRYQESRKKGIEGRKKTEMRYKIKTFKQKLESALQHPTDRQYVPINLVKAMVDVCELIDTDTPLYKADGSLNKAQERRNATKERLQALKDEYENLKTNADPMYREEFDEVIYKYLTKLRTDFEGKSLSDMTLAELNEMYDILKSIDGTLKEARKMIGWGDASLVYEAGEQIIKEQEAIIKSRKNEKRSGVQVTSDNIFNLSLSPVRNIERMTGYRADSPLLKMFKDFEKGVRKKNMFAMESHKMFEALTTGENAKNYEDSIHKEYGSEYTDINGRKFKVSKMMMMQAIMSYEREVANNKHHVENGGFTFADLDLLSKGKLKEAISDEHSHRMANGIAMAESFVKELKDDKWAQDYMALARQFFDGKAKDAVNETYIALKHRIIAKDKNYIPYEVDKSFVVREISATNDIQQTINSYGMLQDTNDKASQPLIITGLNNILERHIEQVGSVYGLAVAVRNFNKVWNVRSVESGVNGDPTVQSKIGQAWGVKGKEFITQVVQDIQGPRHNAQSDLYRKVKSNYIGATFLLNLSVVTKQIGSLFTSTSMLRLRDPATMMANLVYTMANYKEISAEVDKYTASVWMRRQGLSDSELYTLATAAKEGGLPKLLSKLPIFANPTKWIEGMDSAVALSLWKYAKEDTAKRTGLKGEELLKATAEFFDEVIENTQSITDVLHRPEVQKRSDVFSEAFGMFKTDLYQMAGQLQASLGRYTHNKTKENGAALARTAYSITMSAVWGSLMTSLFALLRYKVAPYRDDEDDELTVGSWLEKQAMGLIGDIVGYIFPLAGSEFVGFIENIMYGESDDLVDSLALTAINDLYSTTIMVANSIKEGEMPSAQEWEKLVVKSLQMFGVPSNNIARTVNAIKLHAKDIANREFFSFEAGLNKPNEQRLYDAIISGDAEKIEKAKRNYKDQNAINSALRTALIDNDPRIQEAVMAHYDGDVTKRVAIVTEIVKEGHFSQDLVIGAVNNAINNLNTKVTNAINAKNLGKESEYKKIVKELLDKYPKDFVEKKLNDTIIEDEEETESKEASLYSMDDYYTTVLNGNTSAANTIFKELIKEKLDEGYLQVEAESQVASSFSTKVKEAYMDGDITRSKAVSLLVSHGKKSNSEANAEVKKCDFELKHKIPWSERVRAYRLGKLTKSTLISAVMDIEGESWDDAEAYVRFLDLEKNNPTIDITAADAANYFEHAEPVGIGIEMYLNYKDQTKGITSDKDAKGNSISGSYKKKVMAVINSLPISSSQKDALYLAEGWAKNKLYEAPWH